MPLLSRQGQPIASKPLTDRFWKKVIKKGPDECWPWIGYRTPLGYGMIGYNKTIIPASRASWLLHHGELPDVLVCHRCDHPWCVNPAHLFIGTFTDNNRDRAQKGRSATKENGKWLGGQPRKRLAYCKSGRHEMTTDNARLRGTKRVCHACAMERQRKRRAACRSIL